MELNDNDIYNSAEKDVNLSKGENSLLIKSVEETDFNFTELLKGKQLLSITSSNMSLQISNRSIMKIFNLLTNTEDGENIENNLTNYITCTFSDDNLSYNKDVTANSIGVLETPFKKLLDKTKNYKINIVTSQVEEIKKDLLNYAQQKNKIDFKYNTRDVEDDDIEDTFTNRFEIKHLDVNYERLSKSESLEKISLEYYPYKISCKI